MSNVGYATLQIIPSAKDFASKLGGEVDAPIGRQGRSAGEKLGGGIFATAAKFAAPLAAVFGIGQLISTAYGEVADAARLNAQLAAGIESTGNAANVSVQGMNDLASSIQLMSGQTDDSIAEAQALLLTFTNIKNVGPDKIFDQTTLAAANMAARLGGDAAGSAQMLGKALNDPVQGITALTRAGVQFTDQQKEQIKSMVAAGDTLGAQKLILAELETQFGGSAEAAGKTLPGAVEILKRSFEDLLQMLAGRGSGAATAVVRGIAFGIQGVTPVLEGALDTTSTIVGGIVDVVSGMWTGVGYDTSALGKLAGPVEDVGVVIFQVVDRIRAGVMAAWPTITSVFQTLGPVLLGAGVALAGMAAKAPLLAKFTSVLAPLKAALPAIGTALRFLTGPVGLLTTLFVAAFTSSSEFREAIFSLLGVIGGLVGQVAGALVPIISQLVGVLAPLVTTIAGALVPVFAQLVTAVLPPVAGLLTAIVGAVLPLVSTLAGLLIPVIQALLPVVTTVFGVIAQVVTASMQIVQGIIQVVTGVISGDWSQVWSGIQNVAAGVWNLIVSLIQGAINIVRSVITAGLNIVQSVWSSVWSGVTSFIGSAMGNIGRAVSSGVGDVLGFLGSLPGRAISALGNLGGTLLSAGADMMRGFIEGVKSVAGRIADAVLAPIKNSVEAVKNFLGIASPSKLMKRFGSWTGEGFAIGLAGTADLIEKASAVLAPKVPAAPSVPAPTIPDGGVAGTFNGWATAAANTASLRPVEVNVHPTPGMSEETVAELAARKLMRAGAGV
jgi:phage-related protein